MQNIDYIFKVVLVGAQNVGKSSLMTRYIDQVFNDSYLSTIGIDFKIKTMQVQDKKIKLQIWDTAGQERFSALTQKHFQGAHGCICVFDVTASKSLDDASRYLRMVIEENGVLPEACYLVANKVDILKREISIEQGTLVASSLGVRYLETSAKANTNIQELFGGLAQNILQLVDQKKTNPMIPDKHNQRLQQNLDTQTIKNKAGCC